MGILWKENLFLGAVEAAQLGVITEGGLTADSWFEVARKVYQRLVSMLPHTTELLTKLEISPNLRSRIRVGGEGMRVSYGVRKGMFRVHRLASFALESGGLRLEVGDLRLWEAMQDLVEQVHTQTDLLVQLGVSRRAAKSLKSFLQQEMADDGEGAGYLLRGGQGEEAARL